MASKSDHGPMWVERRSAGAPIVSTWIDEGDVGDLLDAMALWERCVDEAAGASCVVAYHEPGEVWKGAFVEIGAALGAGRPVFVVGDPPGSWINHPTVFRRPTLEDAMDYAEAIVRADKRGVA